MNKLKNRLEVDICGQTRKLACYIYVFHLHLSSCLLDSAGSLRQ